MKRLILLLAILLLFPAFVSAQSNSQITPEQAELNKRKMERLFIAKSFKCTFEDGYFTFWKNGKLEKEVIKDKLSPIFDSIDYEKRTVRMIGNQGASDIFVNKHLEALPLLR